MPKNVAIARRGSEGERSIQRYSPYLRRNASATTRSQDNTVAAADVHAESYLYQTSFADSKHLLLLDATAGYEPVTSQWPTTLNACTAFHLFEAYVGREQLVPYDTATTFTIALLSAVRHLHEQELYHANVSLDSVLAFSNGTREDFRLSSLGGVTKQESVSRTFHSRRQVAYIPPEFFVSKGDDGEHAYGENDEACNVLACLGEQKAPTGTPSQQSAMKADIWSVGVCIALAWCALKPLWTCAQVIHSSSSDEPDSSNVNVTNDGWMRMLLQPSYVFSTVYSRSRYIAPALLCRHALQILPENRLSVDFCMGVA
eukprot:2812503-Pleurochrysis_carterae.AAC.1